MLVSSRRHALEDATLEIDRVIAPQVLIQRIALTNLSIDERVTTAALGRQVVTRARVLCVISGRVRIYNQQAPESVPVVLEAGDVFAMPPLEHLVVLRESGETLEIEGGPGVAAPMQRRLEMRAEYGDEGPDASSSRILQSVGSLVRALRERADESLVFARSVEAIQALAAQGLVDPELASMLRAPVDADEIAFARSLDALFNRLEVCPGTVDIERQLGLSRRTVTRRTHEYFKHHGLSGLGGRTDWRSIRDGYRLFVGVVLMSHPRATTARVARALGYGSAEALCHAFANVSLPTPTAIRERMRSLLADGNVRPVRTISQVVPALGVIPAADQEALAKLA